MTIDTTISLGNVINLLGFILTILVLYSKLVERFTKIETKVEALWTILMRKIEDVQNGRH